MPNGPSDFGSFVRSSCRAPVNLSVHQFSARDNVFLLAGDGIIASEQSVLVPVMDYGVEFTGAFVLSADHAWAVVRKFIRHGSAEDLGHWHEM